MTSDLLKILDSNVDKEAAKYFAYLLMNWAANEMGREKIAAQSRG